MRRFAVVAAVAGAFVLLAAPAASAHPLGNATINHYDGLHLYPDRVTDQAVEDVAEIPTLQRKDRIDTDGNGSLSDAERAAYATAQCDALAAADRVSVDGRRLTFTVVTRSYTERPGAIQLKAGRLECGLTAAADLSGRSRLTVSDGWDGDGIGWHEITAVATDVTLHDSPFPAKSISDTLLRYPNDLLSSPLNVRSGTVATTGGAGASTYLAARDLPVAGSAVKLLNRISKTFDNLVGSRHLTVGVGLLAVLLSMVLGAGHAFLPGHGKTIMAAYLVGKRGRLRDVVTVGATVTLTHTIGVLGLGLAISLSAAFAPTAVEQYLGIVSGLIVAGVGVGLLVSALRRRPWRNDLPVDLFAVPEAAPVPALVGATAGAVHSHAVHSHAVHSHEGHSHSHDHDHAHSHDHPHRHGFGRPHSHAPRNPAAAGEGKGFGRTGLVGLGVAGGLVPSPSALLVLLAAIALGRTAFGVVLVLGYGLGMATALSVAGLLLVRLRDRIGRIRPGRRLAAAGRFVAVLPVLTAFLVLAVGIGLALRAAGGSV